MQPAVKNFDLFCTSLLNDNSLNDSSLCNLSVDLGRSMAANASQHLTPSTVVMVGSELERVLFELYLTASTVLATTLNLVVLYAILQPSTKLYRYGRF